MIDDYSTEDNLISKNISGAFERAAVTEDLSKLIQNTVYKKGKNPDERIFEITLNRSDGANVLFQAFPKKLSKTLDKEPHLWMFRTVATLPGQSPEEKKEVIESYAEGPKEFFEQSFLPKVHKAVFANRYPLRSGGHRAIEELNCQESELRVLSL